MSSKPDPAEGLEPDITTIEDPEERQKEQIKWLGGDPDALDDDFEDFDPKAADRGDDPIPKELQEEDRGDGAPEAKEEEESEEPEAEDDDAAEDDDGDADDSEAEDELPDDEDAELDAEDGDLAAEDTADSGEQEASRPSDNRVPLSRFNEVNERMKRAEQQLQQLMQQQQAAEEAEVEQYDFDAAEEKYMELLLDGKTSEALAQRNEIRAAEKEAFKAETKTESAAEIQQQADMRALEALSTQAEETFSVFNESSPDYNPAMANKVVTFMQGYMSQGMKASDAFVEGLGDVIDMYGLDKGAEEPAPEPEPKPKAKKAPIKKVKQKVAAQKQQGGTIAGKGSSGADAGAANIDISQLSDKELDALPESTLARMRGDFVE